jgi:hypothetical protein
MHLLTLPSLCIVLHSFFHVLYKQKLKKSTSDVTASCWKGKEAHFSIFFFFLCRIRISEMLGWIFRCCCCRRKKQVVINDTAVSIYSQDASSLVDTPPTSPVPASSPAIQPATEKTSGDCPPLVVELPAVATDSRVAGSLVAPTAPTVVAAHTNGAANGATTSSLASLFV